MKYRHCRKWNFVVVVEGGHNRLETSLCHHLPRKHNRRSLIWVDLVLLIIDLILTWMSVGDARWSLIGFEGGFCGGEEENAAEKRSTAAKMHDPIVFFQICFKPKWRWLICFLSLPIKLLMSNPFTIKGILESLSGFEVEKGEMCEVMSVGFQKALGLPREGSEDLGLLFCLLNLSFRL